MKDFARRNNVGYRLHDEYYEIIGRYGAWVSVDAKDGAMDLLESKWPEMKEKVDAFDTSVSHQFRFTRS